jgi:tetratricopeptide (TPR) repeat protein/TolB-like protein
MRSGMKKLFMVVAFTLFLKADLPAAIQTLVVTPFANLSKNHNLRWIGESFPELLQVRLEWPNLNVLEREDRLVAFDRIGIPYSSLLSRASLIKIGQELDANLLIIGNFDCDGKTLRVSASILDLPKVQLSAPLKEEGTLEDLQRICSSLAWQIHKSVDDGFPLNLDSFVARFPAIPNLALENYIRGLIESDRAQQIQFFRQADKAYPNYPEAVFQLGRTYYQQKDYATSSLWLQKLTKLYKNFSQASFLLGLNYLHLMNYDKAIAEFQQLSQTLPLNEVYNNLGIALSLRGLDDRATASFQRAVEGDASETDYTFNQAYHFWKTGNFAGAIKSLRQVLLRHEQDGEAQYLLYKCLQTVGKPEEAEAAWVLAKQLSPRVETWENRMRIPDLFRVQSNFDAAGYRQLQLEIQHLQNNKAGRTSGQTKSSDASINPKSNPSSGNLNQGNEP